MQTQRSSPEDLDVNLVQSAVSLAHRCLFQPASCRAVRVNAAVCLCQDVIILPEEAVYKKVDTGREGERVYLMEIAGNRRFFYWMQDKDADKDEVGWMSLASAVIHPLCLRVSRVYNTKDVAWSGLFVLRAVRCGVYRLPRS